MEFVCPLAKSLGTGLMSTVCHHSPDLISVNHSLMNSVSQWSSRQTESVVFKCSFPRIILPDESDCIIRRKDNLFYGDPSCIRCRGRLPVLPPVEHLQPVEDLGDQRLKKPRQPCRYDYGPDMGSCSRAKDQRRQVCRISVEEHDRLIGVGKGGQFFAQVCHQLCHKGGCHPAIIRAQEAHICAHQSANLTQHFIVLELVRYPD